MPFKKGQSGNPGGRPKVVAEVRQLAQEKGPDAIKKLIELMDCGTPTTELAAANALLDRGYGKPHQTLDVGRSERTASQLTDEELERRIEASQAVIAALEERFKGISNKEKGKEQIH